MGVRFTGRFPVSEQLPHAQVVVVRDGRASKRPESGTPIMIGHVGEFTYDGGHVDVVGVIAHPYIAAELATGAMPARLDHVDGRLTALLLVDPGMTAPGCMITAWAPSEAATPTTP